MANFQKTLDSLQPYVVGIRYVEGTPIVDAIFKEGWSVPEDKEVKKIKGDESMNYFMLYTETNGGVDMLLAYVEKTIRLNQDREKKQELLRKKVGELKELFQKTPLSKLVNLKFNFADDELEVKANELEIETIPEEPEVEEIPEVEETLAAPTQFLDENKQPIPLTEEDKEMIEEEKRAERNRQMFPKPNAIASKKIELPPKRKIESDVMTQNQSGCDCGPNEACDKCIDSKGY